MTKDSMYFYSIAIFFIIACCYIIGCAIDMVTILSSLDSIDTLGVSMITFKPGFASITDMVRENRRYTENDRMRNYAGLHTPIYRVLNATSKALLDSGLYSACTTQMTRGQVKHISYKSHFSVDLAYGYSAVYIGARRIFAVDEWSKTIYHVDSSGMMNVTPYHQNYDMTDVIAQVIEAVEVLKDCYVAPASEPVQETRWAIKRVIQDRPYHGPIKGAKESVQATLLACSRNLIRWKVEWYDMDNPSTTRIESGVWAKAYKVEIDGVTAWLPHSILGEIYSLPWAGSRVSKPVATIDVPQWWYIKNITPHLNLPF